MPGQQRQKRRSIGDDISHHRVALPSTHSNSNSGTSATEMAGSSGSRSAAPPVASREGAVAAAEYARATARSMGRHSAAGGGLVDPRKEIAIPRFRAHEVVLGTRLGRGGFSNVYEIVRFDLQQQRQHPLEKESSSQRRQQRPTISGEDGGGSEIVGVPVGGALADSLRALVPKRRRSSRSSRNSRNSRRSSRGSTHSLEGGEAKKEESDDKITPQCNEIAPNGEHDDASESSSSEDEIPMEQLDRICCRLSSNASMSSADDLDISGNDDEDDDDDEIGHPMLQRGQSTTHFHSYHVTARQFLAQHCIRGAQSKNEPSTPRYALKRLRPEVMAEDDAYAMGAADLVVEARFLASLEHPNVVKIRGMAHGDCDAFASGVEGHYFLVLDRLSETLTQRIGRWRKETKLWRKGRLKGNLFDRRGRKWNDHLARRVEVAFELANALKYLHGKNIIFRDLKPDNVGFDCRGDCKLFDFGLAKELRDEERVDDPDAVDSGHRPQRPVVENTLRASARRKGKMFTDVYEMSAPCGSYRYMAPEVIEAKPYNFSADTYSFAMLLYEISLMKKPYANMGREELIEKVTVEQYRPELPMEGRTALPSSLRSYLTLGWSANLRYRPTMFGTCDTLFKIVESLKGSATDEEKRPSAYDRRRSTFVLRGTIGLGSGGGSNRSLMGKIGSNRN